MGMELHLAHPHPITDPVTYGKALSTALLRLAHPLFALATLLLAALLVVIVWNV